MRHLNYGYTALALSMPMLNSCGSSESTTLPRRPNIVYILADDMGYGDISALNPDSRIPTPTLDSMISRGVNFTDAHSNAAVSTPTRYGTLTGRYAFRSRLKSSVLVGLDSALIEPGRETVATLLARNGYHTACIGKWHLGLDWSCKDTSKPLFTGDKWNIDNTDNVDYSVPVVGGPSDHGFDYSMIIPASLGMPPYVYIENGRAMTPITEHLEAWKDTTSRGAFFRAGDAAVGFDPFTCLQTITAGGVKYIEERAADAQPFFLYLSLTSPHTPWLPSDDFRGRSEAGLYGDFVAMTDDVVAQIYDALERSGVADNTLVIFTSDNGSRWLESDIEQSGHRSNGPFAGAKSDLWEGGHHVPYIATWPEVVTPSSSNRLVSSTDLMATCAEIVGDTLCTDSGEDSFSFMDALLGQDEESVNTRRSMIYHSDLGLFGFRDDDWALMDCRGSGGWTLNEKAAADRPSMQLYNLREDIAESRNLIDSLPDKAQGMKRQLDSLVSCGRSR